MAFSDLSSMQIALICAVVVVAGGVIVYLLQRRHTERLRRRFGEEEYERAMMERGDRHRAEAVLDERTKRVESFRLRALSNEDRVRFLNLWDQVQAHFVDAPSGAVMEADQLLGDVMAARGYPVADFEQRVADISVGHAGVIQNYRAAHAIALSQASGRATTEDLRRAMIHYRALFEDLVREPDAAAAEQGAWRRAG